MHELTWKPEYEIGHPLIDREHKHLFEIAIEAFKPVAPELRKTKIKETITELNKYIKLHFKHEESFMRVIEYPEFQHHLKIHGDIIANVNQMISKISSMSIKEFEKELAFFIEISLIGHIRDEDAKIHKYYENKPGQRHIIHWYPEYIVGQDEIDKEHKMLFAIANEAFHFSESSTDKDKVKELIKRLAMYVKKHFEHEEKYMKDIGYPDLVHHHQMHEKIIEEMNHFIQEMASMGMEAFELELGIFIEKWLVQHIINEDKQIKRFLDGHLDEDLINLEEL